MSTLRPILALAFVSAALTGCASSTQSSVQAAAPQPMAPAVVITPPAPDLRPADTKALRAFSRPAVEKAYYVGRVVDPDHPELMYGDGVVFRREQQAQWDTDGTGLTNASNQTGPLTALRNGAEHPTPTGPDQDIYRARTNELINALLAQNVEMADRLAAVSKAGVAPPQDPQTGRVYASSDASPRSSPLSAPTSTVLPAPTSTADALEPTVTIAPSADNVIELSPALLEPPLPGVTNPFRQRYRFKVQLRESKIIIGGISLGENPVCLIGDRLFAIGDTFETFTVASIDADGIYLQKDAFLLRIPMQDEAITLRYP